MVLYVMKDSVSQTKVLIHVCRVCSRTYVGQLEVWRHSFQRHKSGVPGCLIGILRYMLVTAYLVIIIVCRPNFLPIKLLYNLGNNTTLCNVWPIVKQLVESRLLNLRIAVFTEINSISVFGIAATAANFRSAGARNRSTTLSKSWHSTTLYIVWHSVAPSPSQIS